MYMHVNVSMHACTYTNCHSISNVSSNRNITLRKDTHQVCMTCANSFTVEPPNKGHFGSGGFCPLFRGCPLVWGLNQSAISSHIKHLIIIIYWSRVLNSCKAVTYSLMIIHVAPAHPCLLLKTNKQYIANVTKETGESVDQVPTACVCIVCACTSYIILYVPSWSCSKESCTCNPPPTSAWMHVTIILSILNFA